MSRVSIWARLEAELGKEKEVEEFLKSAQPLAQRERETISWYAITMGIFDTLADDNGRNARIAKANLPRRESCWPNRQISPSRDSWREVRLPTAPWAAPQLRRAAPPALPCLQDLSALCWV
jgi:hypothetical protein